MRTHYWPRATPCEAFAARRAQLESILPHPAVIHAGLPRARNYPANAYPFRANSHFLYLVGRAICGAALFVERSHTTLFVREPAPDDAFWFGEPPTLAALEAELGLPVRALDELAGWLRARSCGLEIATLPPNDEASATWLSALLGRAIRARTGARLPPDSADARLADAVISMRLTHDAAAVEQLRQAAAVTALAHAAGMRATAPQQREAQILAAMTAPIVAAGMDMAYCPIVTAHGEILHHESHTGIAVDGDLILADVGAETPEGWAGDVTRTWPVSGRFSATQRALYEVVLTAQQDAIGAVRPGVRFRDIHHLAARRLVEGLVDLGILRGNVESLCEQGAHALLFCHGVGHLLGLDVHDMEDLGDRAGYAPGRHRPSRFGDAYLRLDRDLVPGMVVTIEPGLYQIRSVLENEDLVKPFRDALSRDRLAQFTDVRGIRIEDDVLVLADGREVLTREIPKQPADVENAVGH